MSYMTVIGGGSWGTTLAILLANKGYDVSLWVYEENLAEEIRSTRINPVYLPGVVIPDSIKVSHRMEDALNEAIEYTGNDQAGLAEQTLVELMGLSEVSRAAGVSEANVTVVEEPSAGS